QYSPAIVADGDGGAIVVWHDNRSGATADLYAQHVLGGGVVDAAWPLDGTALCTAPNNQFTNAIVEDGAGGAIVAWEDWRSDGGSQTNFDIYAQRVQANGQLGGGTTPACVSLAFDLKPDDLNLSSHGLW